MRCGGGMNGRGGGDWGEQVSFSPLGGWNGCFSGEFGKSGGVMCN